VKVAITDTMSFWDDYLSDFVFNPTNSKTFTSWYRVPDDWLEEATLIPERREAILAFLYGGSWRSGNGDGSRYEVLKMEELQLTDAEIADRPWIAARGTCYSASANGSIAAVKPDQM